MMPLTLTLIRFCTLLKTSYSLTTSWVHILNIHIHLACVTHQFLQKYIIKASLRLWMSQLSFVTSEREEETLGQLFDTQRLLWKSRHMFHWNIFFQRYRIYICCSDWQTTNSISIACCKYKGRGAWSKSSSVSNPTVVISMNKYNPTQRRTNFIFS